MSAPLGRAATAAAVLVLSCPPAAIAQPPTTTPAPVVTGQPRPSSQQGRRTDDRMMPQGFSVVLVLADLSATTGQDDVPPAARRALADMKDFLPYKSYKLLDAAWLLGQGTSGGTTRLRGPEEQDYELRLVAFPSNSGSGRVQVQFSLKDTHMAEVALEAAPGTAADRKVTGERNRARQAELEHLEAELRAAREKRDEAKARQIERQIATLRDRMTLEVASANRKMSTASRAVIDTSFAMDVGETVVVGTSRLRGNSRALIALLTAVPPRAGKEPTERR